MYPLAKDAVGGDDPHRGRVRRGAQAADPASVRVVTSDGVLSQRVHAAGASVYPSSTFRAEIDP